MNSRIAQLVVIASLLLAGIGVAKRTATTEAAASTQSGEIAFIHLTRATGVGLATLFVVRPDGSGLRQLTPEGTTVWPYYAWSPASRLIAYIDQHRKIWLVRPDGSGRRLLPNSPPRIAALSWSPDGTKIAITTQCPRARCSTLRLYVVPINGRAPLRLPVGRHLGWGVSWSPTGNEIYYGDGGGISAIHPDGTGRRKISDVGSAGSLSADGTQFAFGVAIHVRRGTDRYRAFGVVDADGKHFHVVTTHAYNEYGVAWSPRGLRILYGRASSPSFYRFHSQGIYVIDSDGRNNHRVTRDAPPQALWPALGWSPDGGSIVYDAGTYKNTDLYEIDIDGRNKIQLTNTPGLDIAPTWVAG